MTDRLSALDASFLTAEKPGFPLHIGGLATFEAGEVRVDDVRRLVLGHLDRLPRFRQKVLGDALGQRPPLWVDHAGFRVDDHVRVAAIPADFDADAAHDEVTRVLLEPLPRDRPLWQMVFVQGLPDGRTGLVYKVHHALVDGVSGAESLAVILDPDPHAEPRDAAPWTPEPPPPLATQLREAVLDLARVSQEVLLRAAEVLRAPADATAGAAGAVNGAVGSLRSERLAPHTSLNVPVGPRRRFLLARQSLADVKRIARAFGVKVNDVVLGAVTTGLRDLFDGRGELATLDHVKVLVPVSLRPDDQRLSLGNQVSGLLATLPLREPDPLERLDLVARHVDGLKQGSGAGALSAVLSSADRWPFALLQLVSEATVHRQPLVNLVVTNVPGPQLPLYLLGRRMLEAFPYVPLTGNMTVGVAILSYDGALNFGVTVDPDACPDADVLVAGITRGFDELAALAG